ncbi:phospholipase D family protein [Zavarzinia sp. CC-PAN008]|uniref:phospholipase D family protein n=1 Tax=Zavarzinia sp. CC-PAN008 TaxID=3243332 RepID=UPI003F74952E
MALRDLIRSGQLRYIDSGSRDPGEALGTWLEAELGKDIAEVRIQSGFFSSDALAPFRDTFSDLAKKNMIVSIVIGSNDGGTLQSHIEDLVSSMGIPRSNAHLGVIYFANAYFHPKAYHIRRSDGSQAAYVGSANLTLSGISGKHVEAGLIVDTRSGDPPALLAQIAAAIDSWFSRSPAGFERIEVADDVARLVENGIIGTVSPPRPPRPLNLGGQRPKRPLLTPLVVFAPPGPAAPVVKGTAADWTVLPTVQRTPPYPPHIFFAPGATEPTRGIEALTGVGLGDAVGLILKLSRDSDRHWRQAVGTSNISVPVSAATTLRFGIYGTRGRPRAEFDFVVRYLDDHFMFDGPSERVGIMSFGFTPGDSGHADLRLAIPKPAIEPIRAKLLARGLPMPKSEELVALEWPTHSSPIFKLTVTRPGSSLASAMAAVWTNAAAAKALASRGAAWLPVGLSPPWVLKAP